MGLKISNIIYLAVGLIVVALIMPLALALISGAGDTGVTINGSATTFSEVADPSVITLFTVLIPVIAVVALVLYLIPKMKS